MHDNLTTDPDSPTADPTLDPDAEETELEQELNLDLTKLDRKFKLKKLADLMDWAGVVRRRRQSPASLTQALKQSGLWVSTYPDSPVCQPSQDLNLAAPYSSLVRDFLGHNSPKLDGTSSVASKTTWAACDRRSAWQADATQVGTPGLIEMGLDAATCLVSESDPVVQSQTRADDFHGQKLSKPDPQIGSAQLTSPLSLLNLGTELEGVSCPDEPIFNYLPPWQPDRISLTSNSNRCDSKTYENDAEVESSDESSEPFVVGRQCASCLRSFNLIRRRHHCRRCGHIFCSSCCNRWQPIEGLATTKPVRICSECHDFLNADLEVR